MTVDASLEGAQHAGGSRSGRGGVALDTGAATELGQELGLLTRALFTQLLSAPALPARASAPSDASLPAPSTSWDQVAQPMVLIDVSHGAGAASADDPAAGSHLELPALESLELDVQSLAWAVPPAPEAPAAVTQSDADPPVIDVPALGDLLTTRADASHEDVDEAPDDHHVDEPEVPAPHPAHVHDLRVLEEIRFLED